jgi:hypothetical protein
MKIWEALTGRSRAKQADLDALFLVPSAAITLQTAAGLNPTGTGSVCFRSAAGAAFQQTQDDIVALIRQDTQAREVKVITDEFGFTWVVVRRNPADMSGLCTDLHAVNTTLESHGFGSGLLCSVIPFADVSGRRVGLVYLYKQGTFYAFAPAGEPTGVDDAADNPRIRDNLLEMSVRDQLEAELPIEPDLSRWFALWGAPGL